jgi:hypothetical protein
MLLTPLQHRSHQHEPHHLQVPIVVSQSVRKQVCIGAALRILQSCPAQGRHRPSGNMRALRRQRAAVSPFHPANKSGTDKRFSTQYLLPKHPREADMLWADQRV